MDTFKYIEHPDSIMNADILGWSFGQLSKNVGKLFLTMMKAGLSSNNEAKSI